MKSILILLLMMTSITAMAGNFVNNGIDEIDAKGDAVWFVGSREIKACIEMDPGFGVTKAEAANEIVKAFATWDQYFKDKGLDKILQSSRLSFSTSVTMHDKCEGNEDIRFYFGVKNNFLVQAAMGFRKPLAFSERTTYDPVSQWGKGFIWFAPPSDFASNGLDWNRDNHLFGAILHELGHVYGCGHIGSTIMRADLSLNILDSGNDFLKVLSAIDSGKQLYHCETCGGSFEGTIFRNDVIEHLIGKNLGDNIEATLNLKSDFGRLPYGTLTVESGNRKYQIPFTARTEIANAFSDAFLFHIPVSTDSSRKESYATRNSGQVYLATLEFGNRKLNVIYKRNMEIFASTKAQYADQLMLVSPDNARNTLTVLTPKQ